MIERNENHAVVAGNPKSVQTVIRHREIRRHPAFAFETTNKGDAGEITRPVVTPVVINTREVVRIAAKVTHQKRAAVGTPIDKGVEATVLAAVKDDRRIADEACSVVALLENLGL